MYIRLKTNTTITQSKNIPPIFPIFASATLYLVYMDVKKRRTNAVIDKDILEATKNIVEQYGFEKATLRGIIQEAGIEPNAFYRRYGDLEDLMDSFVKEYDYFIMTLARYNEDERLDKNSAVEMLAQLINEIYPNKVMQKLLVWEISDNNKVTQRTAQQREKHAQPLREYLDNFFPDAEIDLNGFIALMIGGIYYLILHKDVSAFCGIDYSTKAGKQKLLDTVRYVCDKVLQTDNDKQLLDIARRMKRENISNDIIAKVTGLPVGVVAEVD